MQVVAAKFDIHKDEKRHIWEREFLHLQYENH